MTRKLSRLKAPGVADATGTRAVILAAAINILRQEGPGALTVRSVATAAGCSTTGVYTWFGGKNGLIDEIFMDGFQRFGEAIDSVPNHETPLETLRARGEAYRTWALANPTHYAVMFGGAVPDYTPSDPAHIASMATFESLVGAAAAAVDDGALIGEPTEIAHHLWAGIHGYVSLEIAGMSLHESSKERAHTYSVGLARLIRAYAA